MRITELYIEGFGALSGVKQSFTDNMNTVVAKNGSGKTTLCVFIKAMLFGLGDTRRVSLDENDRKKYLPWSASRAGGMLRITHGGRRYRIERSFGRSASEDTVAVYDEDSGRPLELECEIGEYLLGIDREGFTRTVFVGEGRTEGKIENGSISSRLSEVVGYAPDISEYENAEKQLLERRKFYYKKGGGGKISEIRTELAATESEIAELTALLNECEKITESLAERRAERDTLLEKRAELKKKIADGEAERARRTELIRYRELLAEAEGRRAEMTRICERFGGKLPTRAEIELISDKERAAKSLLSTELGEGEWRELLDFFKTPTDHDEIDKIQGKIAERRDICARREGLSRGEDATSLRMREILPLGKPTDEEISLISLGGGLKLGSVICATAASIFALAGAALGVLVNSIFFALSAVALPLLLFFSFNATAPRRAVRRIINRYFPSGASIGVGEATALFEKKIEEYERLYYSRGESERELSEALTALNREIGAFFDRYDTADASSDEEKILFIRRRLNRLLSLSGVSERKRDAEELIAEAKRLGDRIGIGDSLSLSEAKALLDEYERNSILLTRTENELATFSEDIKGLSLSKPDASASTETLDTASIDEEISRAEREITLMEREREERIMRTEALDALIPKKEALTEELARATETLETIKKVLTLFERTYGNMTEKYIGKTRELFKKYSSLLNETGDFSIDTSFVLTKTEEGKTRAEESYSRGTRDLYSLCMRLALCDSLYGDEPPFLILDDPFSAFDDERLSSVSDMLKKMSKDRQIIYFTCSKSRKI